MMYPTGQVRWYLNHSSDILNEKAPDLTRFECFHILFLIPPQRMCYTAIGLTSLHHRVSNERSGVNL